MNFSTKRFVSLMGLVAVVGCGGASAAAPESTTPASTPAAAATAENWRVFAPEGEGFSVEIPYDPQMQSTDVGNGATQHQYVSTPEDQSIAYMIGVVHRGSVATAEETQAMLRSAYDAIAQSEGATAEAPHAVTLGGDTGLAFSATMTSEGVRTMFVSQMFMHGDKFIQFLAIVDAERYSNALPPSVERFMHSAQLP